jgi:hypothetical protein
MCNPAALLKKRFRNALRNAAALLTKTAPDLPSLG